MVTLLPLMTVFMSTFTVSRSPMLRFSALVVFVVGSEIIKPLSIKEEIDWCDTEFECPVNFKKNPYKNTMCIYDEAPSKRYCRSMTSSTTPEVKEILLAMHNTFRNKLAKGEIKGWPPAADMRQLTWDDALAASALRWAYQCKRGNDHCRVTPDFSNIGQNKGVIDKKDRFVEVWEIFNSWIDEWNKVSPDILKNYQFRYQYQHFTNIAWGWTWKIGCGVLNHTRLNTLHARLAVTLVCNMAPGGNIKSLKIYEDGPPCTACYKGTACNRNSTYQYLCALPSDPSNEVPFDVNIHRNGGNSYHRSNIVLLLSTRMLNWSIYLQR